MLRLENVPPEEMPEVVHIASELYEKDKQYDEESQQRKATVDAAAEVGLPEEYLHRAAQQLHARRVEQAGQKRRRRNGLLAVVGAAVVLGGGAFVFTHPPSVAPPEAPPISVVQPPAQLALTSGNWKVVANKGTVAKTVFEKGSATIHVDRFTADSVGHFTANLNSKVGALDLSKYSTVSFTVRGTLPHVRLYLEHGNERWRSPELAVSADNQPVQIRLDQFEHQTRADANAKWQTGDHSAPGWVDDFSFKTGWYVNDIGAAGDVTLSDFRIE